MSPDKPALVDERRRTFMRSAAAQAIVAAAGVSQGLWARAAHARFVRSESNEKLLERARSQFNDILVTERGSVRTLYFVVDGVRYIESRWDMAAPKSLDLDYSRTMMAGYLVKPKVQRFMMLGLGGGQITNYLFERFPGLEIDGVDIDPEVVRLAQKWFGVPSHPNYRCHVADGRRFVEEASEGWDMLMLDAFRGVFVPYHLKTIEFYRACLAKCRPGGVVVANLHNRLRMYSHDRATIRAVFPNQYAFASESGNQTTLVASAGEQVVGSYAMRGHARELAGNFDFDLQGLAARRYLHGDWDESAELLRDDFEPQDLDAAIDRHNQACFDRCKYPTR